MSLGPGLLTPDNKANMVTQMRASLKDLKNLEEKRINLALRFDFCLTEIFSQIDVGETGYLSLNDLDRWSKSSGISMNREDWANIIDRFDRDRDQYLSFTEFSELFAPHTHTYRKTMQERSLTDVKRFKELTVQSKKMSKDLLYSIVTHLENFECNKYKMTGGAIHVTNECFDFLDRNKDGYITFNEFSSALKECGIKSNNNDLKLLFDHFDRTKDGKISFGEFHTPTKGCY